MSLKGLAVQCWDAYSTLFIVFSWSQFNLYRTVLIAVDLCQFHDRHQGEDMAFSFTNSHSYA